MSNTKKSVRKLLYLKGFHPGAEVCYFHVENIVTLLLSPVMSSPESFKVMLAKADSQSLLCPKTWLEVVGKLALHQHHSEHNKLSKVWR